MAPIALTRERDFILAIGMAKTRRENVLTATKKIPYFFFL